VREDGREFKTDQADRFSRVFDVLELLVGHPDGMTVTEVSKRLDLPTSSTHNLLQRMVGTDVVVVSEDLRYSIGPRAVRLAIRTVDGLEVRSVALRYLEELARETGEDVYLAVRIGRRVVYVERLPGTRTVTVHIRLGQPLYLHATASGKLFAAHHPQLHQQLLSGPRPRLTEHTLVDPADLERELADIRASGYSVSREEAIPGIIGLAIPVYDARGTLAAAIHVSALKANLAPGQEQDILAAARNAAVLIEAELGRPPGPSERSHGARAASLD
jgi:DNA-binding IclR family transcriptional regulator